MNTRNHMILIKDQIKTKEIQSCEYNIRTKKWDITFSNGRTYSYSYQNVQWLREPQMCNPKLYRIARANRELFDMREIYIFNSGHETYWHICFGDGSERDYRGEELHIEESKLVDSKAKNVFEYLKQLADFSELRGEDGSNLLSKQYEKLDFVGNNTVLARYLNPVQNNSVNRRDVVPIFPFGCNKSQYMAVKRALESQISVIQGPPGTGKTQTILNIIANILVAGKTVLVVSNNNSATENVMEKLSAPEYNLGFLVASLGKEENKQKFIEEQTGTYPDFSSWKKETATLADIQSMSRQLSEKFSIQEQIALLKQEMGQLELEMQYFQRYLEETSKGIDLATLRKTISSKRLLKVWQEIQYAAEHGKKPGLILMIRNIFLYGISDWSFYRQEVVKVIAALQWAFYEVCHKELAERLGSMEERLIQMDGVSLEAMCECSMEVLRDFLAEKYGKYERRILFSEEDLWANPDEVLKEYPVILSTTFSSRSSLNRNVLYDYLIMDEASQVDVATGALALSCAKNVVIVGDTKQLPNVVTGDMTSKARAVFEAFHINEGYQFTKSFLQSVLEIIPEVPQTLLREHYRCHPKIINFCNQKFYHGELLIMTQDHGEKDVLSVIRTAKGNHVRDRYSQRQIDVVTREVLPQLTDKYSEIGIIAPYKNQVAAMKREIHGIEIATVHKFQGREKDTIIISTVDDEITDFADDPFLINVAVSRAKKRLCVVVSGNEQASDRNISDLISYIQYQNFEIRESRVYSVFDYLYEQYARDRREFLQRRKKVSEFDSENLMYALLEDILHMERFFTLGVICHLSLNMLVRDRTMLNDREQAYVQNPATHIDFLIFHKLGRKPILAIEVDGYQYHKEGTLQAERDAMKDHILMLCDIPLLRLKTNGSNEREKIIESLKYCMER